MKRIIALLLALAMVFSLAACGGEKKEEAQENTCKELSVYTAFPEEEVIYYFNQFEKETGIKINYVRLSAGEMTTRIEAEKDNPQATLAFGGSTDNYIYMADAGLLEPYQSPNLSDTPKEFIDPSATWNPIYVGCIIFACNPDWFAEKGYEYPQTWNDLLDPKYKGEIIMAHPATSGTAYTVLSTLIQLNQNDDAVWAYLKELDKNMSQYTKSGSAAPKAVGMGEAAIALTFSHDALQQTTEGFKVALSFPTDGTGYEVGATAIIKNGKAEEMDNAKLFIDWITSAAGQTCYAENNSFRVPTNTKAPVAEGLVTLDKVNVIDYDAVWAASVKKDYCAQFEANIIAAPKE